MKRQWGGRTGMWPVPIAQVRRRAVLCCSGVRDRCAKKELRRGGTTFADPRRALLQCMHGHDSELSGRAGHTVERRSTVCLARPDKERALPAVVRRNREAARIQKLMSKTTNKFYLYTSRGITRQLHKATQDAAVTTALFTIVSNS